MTAIARNSLSPGVAGASLVELRGVSKRFVTLLGVVARIGSLLGVRTPKGAAWAVDGVDLAILPGEVVGLVGESGCGKSTLGRLAVGLLELSEGERYWRGAPLSHLARDKARRQQLLMQMIFQDPRSSLNPRMRVVDIVGGPPVAHHIIGANAKVEYVGLLLNRVGLDPMLMRRLPHEFSDGQLARISIARALAVKPEFVVCDDSLAALDAPMEGKLLKLFMDLRAALNLTYLFMSRDLGVARRISDRVVIMCLGRVVESGPASALFAAPNHPYTRALLTEALKGVSNKRTFTPGNGEIPSPLDLPNGCSFHPRCPHAMQKCRDEAPALKEIAPGRWSACHLNDQA